MKKIIILFAIVTSSFLAINGAWGQDTGASPDAGTATEVQRPTQTPQIFQNYQRPQPQPVQQPQLQPQPQPQRVSQPQPQPTAQQKVAPPVGPMLTPEKVAAFDDATKQAWLEMEDIETKRATNHFTALAAALAIGLAALGGAIGQGLAAASALQGFARNPEASGKIFTPFIISLALIESLVIYALVISLILQGKI